MLIEDQRITNNVKATIWRAFLSFSLRLKYFLSIVLIASVSFSISTRAEVIVHAGEDRDDYYVRLLKHVVTYITHKNYQVKAFGTYIPKDRNFELLLNNDGIDVVFAGSTREREQKYLPVRFPLLRGLNGWRIPLVQKGQEDMFSNILTPEQFKKLKPGQFHTWSDTQVLLANNIDVVKGTDYEGLFGMLALGRFDYFPRSVLEVENEYNAHQNLAIAIEQNTIIHYPTAYYFYVSKENSSLAKDLENGLELALQDGSLTRIFNHFYGDTVSKVRDTQRRIIELENHLLPKETPLHRAELWINLGEK